MVNSDYTIVITLDNGTNKNEPKAVGTTTINGNNKFDYETDLEGNITGVDVKTAGITMWLGRIDELLAEESKGNEMTLGDNDKPIKGLSFLDILVAAIGHEIDHTTDENLKIQIKDPKKAEQEASKISDKIIDEINANKKKNE